MTWAISGVTSGNATADTTLGTFTIPSQSYTAGTVYFVGFLWANLVNAQAGALVSITGSGLSPTLVSAANYGASTGRRRLEVWQFTPAVTASIPLLVTFAVGENSTAHCWSVVSANAATTGTLPQAAVMNRSASASTITATLSTFASATNAALGFFGAVGTNGAMTVGSGFTQLHSEVVASGTTICLLSEYKASEDTTIDATAGGVNDIIGIGIELKANFQTVTAGQATETDSSQAAGRQKTVTAGMATSADASQAAGRAKVSLAGQAGETDAGQAPARLKLVTGGTTAEVDTPMVPGTAKLRLTGMATESDSALTAGALKSRTAGQASETDTAQPAITSAVSAVLGYVSLTAEGLAAVGLGLDRAGVGLAAERIGGSVDLVAV